MSDPRKISLLNQSNISVLSPCCSLRVVPVTGMAICASDVWFLVYLVALPWRLRYSSGCFPSAERCFHLLSRVARFALIFGYTLPAFCLHFLFSHATYCMLNLLMLAPRTWTNTSSWEARENKGEVDEVCRSPPSIWTGRLEAADGPGTVVAQLPKISPRWPEMSW